MKASNCTKELKVIVTAEMSGATQNLGQYNETQDASPVKHLVADHISVASVSTVGKKETGLLVSS